MLKTLTSFRFFAALMVYLCHSIGLFSQYKLGYVGVSIFFVLSGFIMVYNYQSTFIDLCKEKIKKYYVARLAKIYPVHFLTLLITIPYVIEHTAPRLLEFVTGFLANVLLVQSFIPLPFGSTPYMFNLVSWSLSTEGFFYLIFPFVAFVILKLTVHKNIMKKVLMAVFFYFIILGLTFISFSIRGVKTDDWFFYVFPLFRSMDFIMGIFCGLIFVSVEKNEVKLNGVFFNVLEFLALGLFLGWIFFSPFVPMVLNFSVYYLPMWCLIIFIFAFQKGWISKVLSYKGFIFLGEISFSFYMVHLIIINYMGVLHVSSLVNHMITLFGSIMVSAIMYRYFEEPLRKKIRNGYFLKNTNSYKKEVSP